MDLYVICAWCKRFKWSDDTWHTTPEHPIEPGTYNGTHGICPDCLATIQSDETTEARA